MDATGSFIQPDDLGPFAQFDASRFCVFEQGRDYAPAFGVTGIRIEESVLKPIRSKRRKTLVKGEGIESFEPVSVFLKKPGALVLKAPRLHRSLANKQNAGLVVELDPEIGVPFSPKFDATFRERSVIFVRPVSGADRFADVGRSGGRMGQGTGIDQNDFVSAFF